MKGFKEKDLQNAGYRETSPGKFSPVARLMQAALHTGELGPATSAEPDTTGEYEFDIDPVGKPRQTQQDKWKKRPAVVRYRLFADELRRQARQKGLKKLPASGMLIRFFIPMPEKWSEARKGEMDHTLHQEKPDLDNLLKSVFDALCKEDSYIAGCMVKKQWAYKGKIIISI